MKKIVILYHKDCLDGFGAAWAAWKKFGLEADYIAVQRGELLPTGLKNKIVYTVDFTYRGELMSKLLKIASEVIIIDHHLSAEKTAKTASKYYFDLNHSGAVLAWKYFHPNKKIPFLLKTIEDFDIWKFKLPHTKTIDAYMNLLPFKFNEWEKITKDLENRASREKIIAEGDAILNYQKEVIKKALKTVNFVKFEGRRVPIVNSAVLSSEIGHELAKKYKSFGVIWKQVEGGKIRVSLRSVGNLDVSKIAQKYGDGGGHKNAAGFTLSDISKLPWKKIK